MNLIAQKIGLALDKFIRWGSWCRHRLEQGLSDFTSLCLLDVKRGGKFEYKSPNFLFQYIVLKQVESNLLNLLHRSLLFLCHVLQTYRFLEHQEGFLQRISTTIGRSTIPLIKELGQLLSELLDYSCILKD